MQCGFGCYLLEQSHMEELCGSHKKEGAALKTQHFYFGDLFLVPFTLFWCKGLFLAMN